MCEVNTCSKTLMSSFKQFSSFCHSQEGWKGTVLLGLFVCVVVVVVVFLLPFDFTMLRNLFAPHMYNIFTH